MFESFWALTRLSNQYNTPNSNLCTCGFFPYVRPPEPICYPSPPSLSLLQPQPQATPRPPLSACNTLRQVRRRPPGVIFVWKNLKYCRNRNQIWGPILSPFAEIFVFYKTPQTNISFCHHLNLARFIFQISLERVWVRQERLDLVMFPAVSHCQLLDVMNENDNNDGENIR